jgi:hypothetical protein
MAEERLRDIPAGTTVLFTDTLLLGGVAPDITADTVTITLKANPDDADPGALQKAADVSIQGAGGIAAFELTSTETDIEPGDYFYEIIWKRSTGAIYRPHFGRIRILKRFSSIS